MTGDYLGEFLGYLIVVDTIVGVCCVGVCCCGICSCVVLVGGSYSGDENDVEITGETDVWLIIFVNCIERRLMICH